MGSRNMREAEHRASSSSSAAVYTSLSFAVRARSVLSLRRSSQVISMENADEQELRVLENFQAHVADRLRSIAASDGEKDEGLKADHPQQHQRRHRVISLSFLQRLLDGFVSIEEEFRGLLLLLLGRDPSLISRPPLDRLVADLLDRAVKSLDVCNAVTHALDSLRFCQKQVEIAASALHPRGAAPFAAVVGEAQFHRARRASSKLLAMLGPDHCYKQNVAMTERAWSFGRTSRGGGGGGGSGSGGSAAVRYSRRCLALDVSQRWSVAKQMHAMWANLITPRGADATALAMAVYTMSAVTVLVMWILLLAFPCQERGGHGFSAIGTAAASFPAPPRQLPWAVPMAVLQEGIAEEWRRRDRKGSSSATPSPGLLAELQSMVRCGRALVDLGGADPAFPLDERQREVVSGACSELAATWRSMEEQLGPLQQRVREVFHRVVHSRAEVLQCLRHGDRAPAAAAASSTAAM